MTEQFLPETLNTYFAPPRIPSVAQLRLDAAIRYQPHERHENVKPDRNPLEDEGQWYRHDVTHERELALRVVADGGGQSGVGALVRHDHPLKDCVRNSGQQHHRAVD